MFMKKFSLIEKIVDINTIPLNSELLYITENGKQVGSLILTFTEGKSSVFSLAILEKYRGKGYSKRLMSEAIDRSKSKGCAILELNTEIANEVANNLYKSMGFELVGILEGTEYNNYRIVI